MSIDSIPELERLLRAIRFLPHPVRRNSQAPLFRSHQPGPESLAIGAAAVICVVLLIFVFWSAVLQLRG